MINQLVREATIEREAIAQHELRKRSGMMRLLGGSAIAMSLALPIGIVPRLMQAQELDNSHASVVNQIPTVSVVPAKQADQQRELKLPGSIEAVLETPVYARTNGYVSQRSADIGDRVKAGQLLARIETPEVDQSALEAQALVLANVAGKDQSEANRDGAQADLDRDKADLSQAKANLIEKESDQRLAHSTYLRWKKLGEQGAVSLQEVDERETRFLTTTAQKDAAIDRVRAAESAIVAARAKLKADAASIIVSDAGIAAARARSQRSALEKSFQNVLSPFDGIITERNLDVGTLVSSGSDSSKVVLYRLARIDTVKVFVDVPQFASSGVRVGQSVNVALKEFPNRMFTGTVARTSVALDPSARTLRTEIHLPNDDLALAPGMYADVTFHIPRTDKMFLIPANAIVTRSKGQQVGVLASDNKVHFKNVEIGDDLGKEVEISKGLHEGDLLVVNPSDAVTDGVTVAKN